MSLLLLFLFSFLHGALSVFTHPGVLVSPTQLSFIKDQVAKKSQPIYGAFVKALDSPYGSPTYNIRGPPGSGIIECGSYSKPNIGCSDADSDASAAYTHALLWAITGNTTYSDKAIEILNHYGSNLKGYNNSNAPLQAAWDCQKWPAAAELIRHTGASWSAADITKFSNMLQKVILPHLYAGSGSNGNWEISMIDGMIGIAVFTEDSALFDHAVTFWKQRTPAYFYYHTDGSSPVPAPRGHPSWYGQSVFDKSVDGVCQETCRDFGHTQYGIAGTVHAAETAHIQGVDLYGSQQARLVAAMEFHTFYLLGNTVPNSVCGGTVDLRNLPTFEVVYNHYHNRLGVSMPNTLAWIQKYVRTDKDPVDPHMVVFETLTHGANAP